MPPRLPAGAIHHSESCGHPPSPFLREDRSFDPAEAIDIEPSKHPVFSFPIIFCPFRPVFPCCHPIQSIHFLAGMWEPLSKPASALHPRPRHSQLRVRAAASAVFLLVLVVLFTSRSFPLFSSTYERAQRGPFSQPSAPSLASHTLAVPTGFAGHVTSGPRRQ